MTLRIRDIFDPLDAFGPETTVGAALQYFRSMPELAAVPVVYDAVPLGILSRATMLETRMNSDMLDRLLHNPVTDFMSTEFQLVDLSEPAALVCKKLSDNGLVHFSTGVIVVEGGRYAGYVSPEQLFAAVTQENTSRARAMQGRAKKFADLRDELGETRQEHARFVSFLAHEIRTPLTGVLGVADLLADSKLDPSARDFAKTISQSGQHLDNLLGDILDLTRLDVGKLEIAPVPFKLSDFAKETRTLWSGRADKKNISLRVSLQDGDIGRIEADATRLRQILFNLIGNAMKFTENGTVSVDLNVALKGRGQAELEMSVTDTGIGISDEDKQRLFKAFEQATPQTVHKYGGTGLGLSIAKGLVDRMDGTIALSDNPGGGAVFKVTLPVRKAGPRLAVENVPKRRKANFELGRILLVEDHDISRTVVAEALRAVGWSVDIVETAEQGLRRGQQVPYQAMLIDLHLGDASGIDIVETLRSGGGSNASGPMIAVSADVSNENIKICEQAGFDGFISKPIRPRNLVATLVDIIIEHDARKSGAKEALVASSQQAG